MTPARPPLSVERLRELDAAATKGPWRLFHQNGVISVESRRGPAIVAWSGFDNSARPEAKHAANADFIAAARTAVPDLVAENERLKMALVNAALPLEVIAAQDRWKPYAELTRDLIAEIDAAILGLRAALAPRDTE